MIKQTLVFSNPADLSLRNRQMVIAQREPDRETTRPIEDMAIIIIENPMVRISVPLLNAIARQNGIVIFCDDQHLPQSLLTGMTANTTQAETLKTQAAASAPLQKQAWKQIIESKIRNQAHLLDKIGKDGSILKPYYNNVKSGDSDNREGIAARIYWQELFGPEFSRERYGEAPNNMLNYGYSILRAATIRAIIGSGLSPAFGIFHHNRYNPYPLGDDLMEPFRPFVDEIVYTMYCNGTDEIDRPAKSTILSVLQCDTVIGKNMRPLQLALTSTTASFASFLKQDIRKLVLPSMPCQTSD